MKSRIARSASVLLMVWAFLVSGKVAEARNDTVVVPDLTGLAVPQAARAAGLANLTFGTETIQAWTADAKVKANQVSAQEPAAGTSAPLGSPVNVTVLRVYNAALRIDASSLMLFNLGDAPLDLTGVVFKSADGLRQFNAPDWGKMLLVKKCNQLWAVAPSRTPTPDCAPPNRTLTVAKTRQFWVGTGFSVERNADVIGLCPASESRCEVALPQGDDPEHTSYLGFNYRTNYLQVRNDSERWMGLPGAQVIGLNGVRFDLEIQLDGTGPGDIPWAGSRLAPGQCMVLSDQDIAALPPFDCTVVAYVRLTAAGVFWTKGFTSVGPTGRRSTCSAPRPGQLSICRVPR